MMAGARLVIAGTSSNVGKTTVTLALLAALAARGRRVQPFKGGPDYIDPGHHTMAAGRPSRNLDGWMLTPETNRAIFSRAAADADIAIVEGMMGLFDGSSPIGEVGSTAEIAKLLGAPVLLVVDGSAMARSAAAMVQGYARFDPAVRVAGVLFNRVGSEGHFHLLKTAVEAATDVAVVGYLKPDQALTIDDRHLGLRTAIEQGSTDLYRRLGQAAAETVDVDRIEALARAAGNGAEPLLRRDGQGAVGGGRGQSGLVRVGIAYDPAFCFYYQDNLDLLEAEGAEIVRFSPMRDGKLPDAELLYFGGGYPELYGDALAANDTMRRSVREFAERGGPIYAECGGMMYLTSAIRDFEGRRHEMVGLFPAEAVMRKPGLTLGYREVTIAKTCLLGAAGTTIRGHEFHYSTLVPEGMLDRVCAMVDAQGRAVAPDGLCRGNTVALYTHLHFASRPAVPRSLVETARAWRERRKADKAAIS